MPSTPQFGGTNGVPELDAGQVGSARRAANEAYWTVRVRVGADKVASAQHALPGQARVFRSTQGRTGQTVTWEGNLKLKDGVVFEALRKELDAYRHGGIDEPDPNNIKSTTLKDRDDQTLSTRAVLTDWEFTTDVRTITGDANYTRIVGLRVTFECLG